jgi:hypothetical protein
LPDNSLAISTNAPKSSKTPPSTVPTTDWFGVRFDTGASDTNFTLVTSAASTVTTSASSVAADTNFHHFRIWSTVAGTINMSVDGGTTVSSSTNVPTGGVTPFVRILTRTTATKVATVDFISYMAATGRV